MAASKNSQTRFRYQLQLLFDTEEEKEESMDTVRMILSGGFLKELDNLALLRTLLAMVQEHGDRDAAGGSRVSIDPRSTVTDTRHNVRLLITIVIYYFTSMVYTLVLVLLKVHDDRSSNVWYVNARHSVIYQSH